MIPKLWENKIIDGKPIILLGAHDALSALIAHQTGFDGIWWSGFGVSTANGVPDKSIISPSDMANEIIKCISKIDIPHIVDCDSGYGGLDQLNYATRIYEQLGVSGLSIEDKLFPKTNSFFQTDTSSLCTIQEMCNRIKNIRNMFGNELLIIARTEILVQGGSVSQALERANAYISLGADAIIVHSIDNDIKKISDFANRWKSQVPLIAIPTAYGHVDQNTLFDLGYQIIIYANALVRSAGQAMIKAAKDLLNYGCLNKINSQMISMYKLDNIVDNHNLQNS